MKQVTLLLWLFWGQYRFAQSPQISVEAGLHRFDPTILAGAGSQLGDQSFLLMRHYVLT